jgi:poly(3-hydroxybutyrate) depolymerase
MEKSFYIFASLFLMLGIIASVFTGTIHFLIGSDIFRLESFRNWHIVMRVVVIAGSLFVLKYYLKNRYMAAFWSGVAALATFAWTALVFEMLLFLHKEFERYYLPALYTALSVSIVHACCLVYSETGRQPRLKLVGMLSLISGIGLLLTVILLFNSDDAGFKSGLEEANRIISLASSVIPILFVLHFREKTKATADAPQVRKDHFSESLLGLAFVVSAMATLYFVINITTESYGRNHVSARDNLVAMPFERRAFVSSKGDTLFYRLLKPLHYDPAQKYPIVVCLHGGAGWGTDNVRQVAGSLPAQMLSEPANREKYPAFLFVPQCARGESWGGLRNHKTIDELAFKAIGALEHEFSIDQRRRYVTGNSLGGYGVWHFLGVRPDMFAAGIPISGEGDPGLGPKMASVPVWAFHGDQDLNVPVSGSRNMIRTMQFAGGNPKYTEYKGAGHDIWRSVKTTPGLLDWLFAQKRE